MKNEELVKTLQAWVAKEGPQPGSFWRHFRGGEYEVLVCSIDEPTLAPVVTYQSVEFGYIWTRPLSVWTEIVKNIDGEGVPRFTEISYRDVRTPYGGRK